MSKSALTVLVMMSMVVGSLCAISRIPGEIGKSKDQEGFCSYQGELIKKGENIVTKNCEKAFCGSDYSIEIHGCGIYDVKIPNCVEYGKDLTKPYPDCCTPICVAAVL